MTGVMMMTATAAMVESHNASASVADPTEMRKAGKYVIPT
jgi:hypothetical protein